MNNITEPEAIGEIESTLSKVDDPEARIRIIQWAITRFIPSTMPSPLVQQQTPTVDLRSSDAPIKKKRNKGSTSKKGYTTLKNISLQPDSKTSFKDFANQKLPTTNSEKLMVAVYYLKSTLETTEVSAQAVYTVFKMHGWRPPANLDNVLQVIASTKAWLDTSDMKNIIITTAGENLVEFDLPKSNK